MINLLVRISQPRALVLHTDWTSPIITILTIPPLPPNLHRAPTLLTLGCATGLWHLRITQPAHTIKRLQNILALHAAPAPLKRLRIHAPRVGPLGVDSLDYLQPQRTRTPGRS